MRNIRPIFLIPLFALLAACRASTPPPTPTTAATQVALPTETPLPAPTETPPPTEPPLPTELPPPTEAPEHVWPSPVPEQPALSRTVPSAAQVAVGTFLSEIAYPVVEYLGEMASHGRIPGIPEGYLDKGGGRLVLAEQAPALTLESRAEFWVQDNDLNTWNLVEMKMLGISDHAYFWFDTARDPEPDQIDAAEAAFEAMYEDVRAVFGPEDPLGIDGDPRVHVLHPAGTRLCNVSEDMSHTCTVAGYFWSLNQYPPEVFPHSNAVEAIIMNLDGATLGGGGYAATLTHEFRHLVEYWYDDQSETWEIEGSAVMAEDLIGFRGSNITFANTFMGDPDVQLNSWPISLSARSIFHYGQGYVFNRYLFDRLGRDIYAQWVQDSDGGFQGLDKVLSLNGLEVTAQELWLDWLATLVLFGNERAPEIYRFGEDFQAGLAEVGTTAVGPPPRTMEGEVRQFAADFYRFLPGQDAQVSFTGSTLTTLVGDVSPSGERFWYSGRANGAFQTLTLEADLSGVETATLKYSALYKLARAFDFAYVVISTDGGETWTGLVTETMKGESPEDDPNELALVPRFYGGNSPGGSWVDENIDLTPYAGQEVLIRFENNAGLRAIGFAIDNIAIPEIDFYDDVENEVAGWSTDTWVRATAYVPQAFHLILVSFDGGTPVVQEIPLNSDNTAEFDVTGLSDGQEAYLIVAASAPHSQSPTSYQFEVTAGN